MITATPQLQDLHLKVYLTFLFTYVLTFYFVRDAPWQAQDKGHGGGALRLVGRASILSSVRFRLPNRVESVRTAQVSAG